MQSQKNEVTNNFRKIEKLYSMLRSLSLPAPRFSPLSLWISAPSLGGLFPSCTVTMIRNTNILLEMCMKNKPREPLGLAVTYREMSGPNVKKYNTNILITIFLL